MDNTCCGFTNWDTFTVAVTAENVQATAKLIEMYVSASCGTIESLMYNLQLSPTIAAIMRQENVIESNVNWRELAEHFTTK